jgi:hypothetical protein
MKRLLVTLAAVGICGLFWLANAQPCPMCPGGPPPGKDFRPMRGPMMGMGPRREMMREQIMENGERETIRGSVVSIHPARRGPGIRIRLESESRMMSVMVPPAMPLDQLEEELERGDRIVVSGARVMRMGEPVLIAMKIHIEESGQTIHIGPGPGDEPQMMMDEQAPQPDEPPPPMDRPPHCCHGRAM